MVGGGKNTHATHLSADAVAQHTKLYKNEEIPLTISGSLMRTRIKTANAHEPIDQYDSNESNDDNGDGDGDSDYTYNNPHSNPTIIHYSTMSSNARDYFRKTAGHLHRSVNNNSSTIPSTNCYRWHNQSDEVVLHSLRNSSMTIAAPTKAKAKAKANAMTMTMHANHRAYNYPDRRELQHKQQQHHHHQHQQNQINNNCIVTNKKQSIMIQNTHNNHNSIDQNNGNQYPPRLYH